MTLRPLPLLEENQYPFTKLNVVDHLGEIVAEWTRKIDEAKLKEDQSEYLDLLSGRDLVLETIAACHGPITRTSVERCALRIINDSNKRTEL